jgi:hypothetical protein
MNRLDAFTLLCNCISPCKNSREELETLHEQLLSAGTAWEPLVAAANQHLLCPALYGAIKHKNLLSSIPADLREYLQTLYYHNGERNRQLADHTEETILLLNDLGVEPVLLKGTANLLSGLYLDQSMRFISDIDMLIPGNRMTDCIRKLKDAGFDYLLPPEADCWKNHHHCPPLFKKNRYFLVELHRELMPDHYQYLINADSVLSNSIPLRIGTARARIPSLSHRIIHNIAHAQLTDRDYHFGDIQLRQLYDLVLLADKIQEKEWREIELVFRRLGYSSALSGYLLAGKQFFKKPLPIKIRQAAAARLYLAGLYVQADSLWLMRLGNLVRLAIFYGSRLKRLVSSHRLPKMWDPKIRQNHYSQMRYILNRNW